MQESTRNESLDDLEFRLEALKENCDSQNLNYGGQKSMGMMAAPASKKSAKVPATFDQLINCQSSDGFWQDQQIVLSFIDGTKLNGLLQQYDSKIVLTLLAIHILQKMFPSKKQEWVLITKKAQKWLKQQKFPETVSQEIKKIDVSSGEDELAALMAI